MIVIAKIMDRPVANPECSMAQGTAKSDVPIIVFHIAILKFIS